MGVLLYGILTGMLSVLFAGLELQSMVIDCVNGLSRVESVMDGRVANLAVAL